MVQLHPYLDGCQAALVEGYVSCDQAAQAVDDGAVGHCRRGVEVAVHLGPSAGKVKGGRAVTPAGGARVCVHSRKRKRTELLGDDIVCD